MAPVRRRLRLPFVDLPIPHGLRFFFLAVVAAVDLVAVAVGVPVVAVAAVVVLAAVVDVGAPSSLSKDEHAS